MHTNLKSLARSQLLVVEEVTEEVAEMIVVAVADVAEAAAEAASALIEQLSASPDIKTSGKIATFEGLPVQDW